MHGELTHCSADGVQQSGSPAQRAMYLLCIGKHIIPVWYLSSHHTIRVVHCTARTGKALPTFPYRSN